MSSIASPLLPSYRFIELEVFEEECDSESGNKTYIFYNVHRCMGSILPLLITFLWLYSHVALLIWKRTRIPKPTDDRLVESSTTDTTNIGTVDCRKQLPNNNCITNNCRIHPHQNVFVMNKQSLERKLRTFKVILILMCVFFICRLPTWLFMVIKQSMLLNKNIHWFL
ncbi:uncharacterized protein LOC123301176 [Chrysoperla carnea]|uniref:uncharacterized protein LOC123301176 n=1 Tax=Chrysoperla carnea TaxID=189513 RepID=UPI001D0607CA|nr:uncharacterized protein LOC123301176 [Chrysoperla carnea]